MRDTLLLVLAAIGGACLVSSACAMVWVAGNLCIDWYDRIVKEREVAARFRRVEDRVQSMTSILARGRRPYYSIWAEGWSGYSTVDELIAESGRRAGARGERVPRPSRRPPPSA